MSGLRRRRRKAAKSVRRVLARCSRPLLSGRCWRELRAALGPEWPDAAARQRALDALAERHADYVTNVSSPDMALSLETAVLLEMLCQTLQPRRILDLGSGFSSLVLRRHAASREGVGVVSVDDSPEWLERTRECLRREGLPEDGLVEWSQFRDADGPPFDLVLHDLGSMLTRERSLAGVLERVAPGRGVAVLDDVHKPVYARAVRALLAGRPHRRIDLAPLSVDRLGRYAWLVTGLEPR